MAALRNPRHERFAQGLAEGLSAVEAWARAGYKRNRAQASRAQHRDDIAQRVTSIVAQRAERLLRAEEKACRSADLSAEWVISRLMEMVERCLQKTEVRDMWGEPTGVWKFNDRGAAKGLELLGKKLGIWKADEAGATDVATILAALAGGNGSGQRTNGNGERVFDA